LPALLGHEGSGVVEAVGANVNGVHVGDHVVLTFNSCGACPSCVTARPSHCHGRAPGGTIPSENQATPANIKTRGRAGRAAGHDHDYEIS
jgi:aryl-alcohol dehydrogenase